MSTRIPPHTHSLKERQELSKNTKLGKDISKFLHKTFKNELSIHNIREWKNKGIVLIKLAKTISYESAVKVQLALQIKYGKDYKVEMQGMIKTEKGLIVKNKDGSFVYEKVHGLTLRRKAK